VPGARSVRKPELPPQLSVASGLSFTPLERSGKANGPRRATSQETCRRTAYCYSDGVCRASRANAGRTGPPAAPRSTRPSR